MELDEALDRVAQIHAHVLRAEVFRGYRALPTAITGVVAIAAAGLQELWFGVAEPSDFVTYWLGVATLCAAIFAVDFAAQARAGQTGSLRRVLPVFVQYVPTLIAGVGVSYALGGRPEAALLPGIWAVLHGLGIFASRPYLPRAVGWVALLFVLGGTASLTRIEVGATPSPWAMGVVFGIGQALLAVVLHLDLERPLRQEIVR